MKQLITRIDEGLHRRLAQQARREGRSVNSLVTEVLSEAVASGGDKAVLARNLDIRKRRMIPPAPRRVPSIKAIENLTKGAGTAASEAITEQRTAR